MSGLSAEGIRLTPVPSGTWDKDTSSSSGQKFRLRLVNELPAKFCHYPQVRDGANVLCCPADPVIANEPN